MAKQAKPKKEKTVVSDKDNPSLIEVAGKIRLRVLEDFNIETELPKWVKFREEWKRVKHELGICSDTTDKELENKVNSTPGKTDEEKAAMLARAKALIAMDKAVNDDRWHIREKHEREVKESILKQARYVRELTTWDKIKNKLRRGPKILPVDVAMDELLEHIELTSTPELEARLIRIRQIEDGMRAAGQYKKADAVKSLRAILVEEAAVAAAGFTSYVTEDVMIQFLQKSERGTMVEFLRYYEDEIPQEAVEKKLAADKLMIFDNYVVVHYSDLISKAANVEKTESAEKEKKERAKRRDPILFGLIKNSRKLYYICDWVTDTDDLTLEKLEKELGVTRGSLVDGAGTQAASTVGVDRVVVEDERDMRRIVRDLEQRVTEQEFLTYSGSRGRFAYDNWSDRS